MLTFFQADKIGAKMFQCQKTRLPFYDKSLVQQIIYYLIVVGGNWLISCTTLYYYACFVLTHLSRVKMDEDIFKYMFSDENVWISIKMSLFVPHGPINNISSLVQVMLGADQAQAIIWTNDG